MVVYLEIVVESDSDIGTELREMKLEPFISELDLSNQHILSIDLNQLTQFPFLTELNLSKNQISDIDLEPLSYLDTLEILDISSNWLTDINLASLQDFPKLNELNLSGNRLTSIELQPLAELKTLNVLVLSGNQISEIDLSPLQDLTVLNEIHLTNNELIDINLIPLSSLGALSVLNLGSNNLTEINLDPLQTLDWLHLVDISNNGLIRVSLKPLKNHHELTVLNLSNNELTEVDLEPLYNLQGLAYLNISGNQLNSIDLTHLFKCTSLNQFLHDRDVFLFAEYPPEDTNTLSQPIRILFDMGHVTLTADPSFLDAYCKLIFVGNTAVGKTSLLRKICELTDSEFSPAEGSTRGVVTTEILIPRNPNSAYEGDYIIRAWDFAGQIEYTHLHQLFFSSKALYFFLFRPERIERTGLEEWHNAFERQSGGDGLFVPIRTHLELDSFEQQELMNHLWRDRRERMFQRLAVLSSSSPIFHGILELDAKSGTGVDNLIDILPSMMESGPATKVPRISKWSYVYNNIENLSKICREEKKLGIYKYDELLNEFGKNQPSDLRQILRYMHEKGILINLSALEPQEELQVLLNPDIASKIIHKLHLIAIRNTTRGIIPNDQLLKVISPNFEVDISDVTSEKVLVEFTKDDVSKLLDFATAGGIIVDARTSWIFPHSIETISLKDEDQWNELKTKSTMSINWYELNSISRVITSLLELYKPIGFWQGGMLLRDVKKGVFLYIDYEYHRVKSEQKRILHIRTKFRAKNDKSGIFEAAIERLLSHLNNNEEIVDIWGETICRSCGQPMSATYRTHRTCPFCLEEIKGLDLRDAHSFFISLGLAISPLTDKSLQLKLSQLLDDVRRVVKEEGNKTRRVTISEHEKTRSHLERALTGIMYLYYVFGEKIDNHTEEVLIKLEKSNSGLLGELEQSCSTIAAALTSIEQMSKDNREGDRKKIEEIQKELREIENLIPRSHDKKGILRKSINWCGQILKKGIEKVPIDEIAYTIRSYGPAVVQVIHDIAQAAIGG